MRHRAIARRAVIQAPRLCARKGDEVLEVFHRQRRMHRQHKWADGRQRHRRKIAQRVIRHFRVHIRINGERPGAAHHQRITVGRGLRHHLGADHAARAAAIFNHKGVTQRFGQALRQRARDKIGAATRREWHDEAYWFCGVALRMPRTSPC